MSYEPKNMLLLYPGDWAINNETLKLAKGSLSVFEDFYGKVGEDDRSVVPLQSIIKEPLKEVYTAPIFSETFCKIFKNEIDNIKQSNDFKPNDSEDELRQIPEFVINEQCPDWHKALMEIVKSIINPLLLTIWGKIADQGHFQIANYSPSLKKKGAWHHDMSSDFTLVIPFNTGEYEGGGTEFMGRGTLNPLPNGSAVIFPGLTHMHRGLSVESGDRYLLVMWLKCKRDDQ